MTELRLDKPLVKVFLPLTAILTAIVLLLFLTAGLVFGFSFDYTVSRTSTDAGVNESFNFSISATSSSGNISALNITLPSGFTFVTGSSGSTVSVTIMSFKTSGNTLMWSNTASDGVVNATDYFWFYAVVPKTLGSGPYAFNITTRNITGSLNSTNVTISVYETVWSWPKGWFYIKPPEIRLNWTTVSGGFYYANITVVANNSINASYHKNVTLQVTNFTSILTANYSQSSGTGCSGGIPLVVRLENGTETNMYDYTNAPTSDFNRITFMLINRYLQCYPGRYYTANFSVYNYSSTDYANVSVILDIPITHHNTLNNVTGVASFDGIIPANESKTYHSFYFNATNNAEFAEINSSSGVVINLTSSSDVDIFLFDADGNLRASSVNKTHNNESMMFSYLPTSSEIWEIRIFGNSTSAISYRGNILFTTLVAEVGGSAVSVDNPIVFGDVDVGDSLNSTAVVINKGNLTLTNVKEYIDVYAVKYFGGNSSSNFSLFVPNSSIANKVKVVLNWTGVANYSFNLYNQSSQLVASSANRHIYANISGAMQEEYAETATIGATMQYWKIEVMNTTNSSSNTNRYTLASYIYVAPSDWINTNYTTRTFNGTNRTADANNQASIEVNLTVPATALNGSYESIVRYLDDRGAGIAVKLKAEVLTPMLLLNDTMSSATYTMAENYGGNLTRSFYFNISNPGSHTLTVNITDNGKIMSCVSGSYTGYEANFSYTDTLLSIPAGSSTMFRVNMSFNGSVPANSLFEGWINLNGTNSIANLSSHPYANFRLTFRVNFTNEIDVGTYFKTADGNNEIESGSRAENITIRARLYYKNGTEVRESENFDVLHGLSNFTAVWLQEGNLTIPRATILTAGNLSFYNGTSKATAPYCSGTCPETTGWNDGDRGYYIYATIPANTPGGRYKVNLNLTYNLGNYSYVGRSLFNQTVLFINNTGLHMTTTNSTSFSMSNSSRYDYFVNVSNYGPLAAASATITFSESCSGYSTSVAAANKIGDGCTIVGSPSSGIYTFNLGAFNSSCMFIWNITAGTSAADACTANIIGSGASGTNNVWFDTNAINISITVTAPSSSPAPTGTSGSTTSATTTYVANLAFTTAPTLVTVVQNSSAVANVQLKNTGNKSQAITFKIDGISSSWWSANATSATLSTSQSAGFKVNFSVGNIESKDYACKFNASSSEKIVTSDFTLRIMPSAKSQTEIKTNLTIYRSQILQLGAAINTTKLQGYNVSSAETSFNVLMVLLEQAETYANAGDYFNANQLLDDIKSQMATVNSNLESAKQVQPWPIDSLKLVLIIVVVAVAGFLVYLFWPSRSSYSPGRGYAYRTEEKKIHKEDFASAMRKVVGTTKEAASRMKKKVEKKKEYAEWGQES